MRESRFNRPAELTQWQPPDVHLNREAMTARAVALFAAALMTAVQPKKIGTTERPGVPNGGEAIKFQRS